MTSSTPAVVALASAGVQHRLHRYTHHPSAASFGREAAEELGIDPARVFKTLVTSVGGSLVVAVVPVTGEVDMKALASAMDAKTAEMADPAVAERATGYVIGGISPFGLKRRLPVVVDQSMSSWDTVYVSGGRRGLELEVAPADLVAVTEARVAPIGRGQSRS